MDHAAIKRELIKNVKKERKTRLVAQVVKCLS